MTVKMSSEGDSSKNLSSETNEKSEGENTDSSQEVKDAKPDAPAENSVEKKDDDSKPSKDASKESSDETDKKSESSKVLAEKTENAKGDVKATNKKEAKAKAEAKAKEETEEENTEEDEEGSEKGEDDKEVPLLDQPLEKTGKRERKNVERFKEELPEPKETEFPNGSGTPLGSIPRIDASISRFKNDDMKLLHRILFRTPGKTTLIKKNIKKFNGFEFKKDSEEYTKKIASMHKSDIKQLKSICEMLDLEKSGVKDDIIKRILDFLLEPKDSGKPVGGGRPKRASAVRANNRGYSSHDNYSSDERHSGRAGRDKGRRSNLKDDSSSASDEDFEPSDEGSDEKPRVTKKRKRSDRKKADSDDEDASEVESASSEDSDFQDEPKTKRKRNTKANNKTKSKGTGKRGRKPAAAKKPVKGGKKKKDSSEEDEEEEESEQKGASSSSEDEPLAKKATKAAQPPTDEEIKSYVKEILDGANLEEITMKTVCQQVYAHYPDFDLAHKKEFIKSTVKSLIST